MAVFVDQWNKAQGFGTPRHHVRIARWLEARWRDRDRHLLLMAFRSAGKSTLVGLFAAWLLRRWPEQRILVLSADQPLARRMVRNTRRIIERHPMTGGMKPQAPDEWAAEQFTIDRPVELREPSMLARGITANITGGRADVVICDDVEVPNTCDTAPKRSDLRDRLAEIDYVLTPGGLQLYVGTPHTYYTLYASQPRREAGETAPFLDGFERLEVPLLDDDGACAWPERYSPGTIEQYKRRHGANKFLSQMQLQPVSIADARLDPDRLRPYADELDYHVGGGEVRLRLGGRRLVSATCWWDPAFAETDKGDGSVIACVFVDAEGGYWLHRVRWLNREDRPASDEDEATRQCSEVARFLADNHLPAVSIEVNGLGKFLPSMLREVLKRHDLAASVVEITSRRPKELRILEGFDALLAAGALHAHESVWDTPFVTEMREWHPGGGKGHDDGLDAVAGCLASQPIRLPRLPPGRRRDDWRPSVVHVAETDFDP
ncbi:MAG: phage terminase large subunit [Alphaproteobacteria bacterium]|nr:phage terminase large subunit [Alphaproteobacteria bacterium]